MCIHLTAERKPITLQPGWICEKTFAINGFLSERTAVFEEGMFMNPVIEKSKHRLQGASDFDDGTSFCTKPMRMVTVWMTGRSSKTLMS